MCQSRTISIIILLSFQWGTARQCNWSPPVHPLHKRHFWSFRPCHHNQALCRWLKNLYRHIIPLSTTSFQRHLNLIHSWSLTWQLNIAFSKCNTKQLGAHFAPHHLPPLHIADQLLASTTLLTDLGIKFDNYLKFNDHIQDIVNRAYKRSNLIFRCFLSKDTNSLVRAYKTYVRPLLEYIIQSFGHHRLRIRSLWF